MNTTPMYEPTLNDIMRIQVKPMNLSRPYREFFGNLPREFGWSMQITGAPGTGKSTFVMGFAAELSRHGRTLYVCAEEVHMAGTLQIRARLLKVNTQHLVLPEITSIVVLRKYLDSKRYKFCVIDSINTFNDATDYELTALTKEYPDIGFVFVAQTNKDRVSSRGSGQNEHNVYATFETIVREDGSRYVIHSKNRYGGTLQEIFVFKGAAPVQSRKRRRQSGK